MPILKARRDAGFFNITDNLKLSGNVIAPSVNLHPWGSVYYVDGSNGAAANSGLSPSSALNTIQAAITKAGVGDIIYIRPKTWTSLEFSYPGLNTAYAQSLSIAYAKAGLAIVGVGNQGFHGAPHGVVIRQTASAITANMSVYAPLCAFENLAFENGGSTETGGQLIFKGGTAVTYEANGPTVYNCYFFYANGTTGPGNWGGAVMADQIWGLTVDSCYFLGCRVGISFQSGGATAGSFAAKDNWFGSRNLTPTEIDADIAVYTQGAANILITGNNFAHLIPVLSGGSLKRWVAVQGDVRQGIISNNYCGGVIGTNYTVGVAGTGISCPANMGTGGNYGNGKIMASTTP
jgi:hypothetical protein